MLCNAFLFLAVAYVGLSTPLGPVLPLRVHKPHRGHLIHLSDPPSPECFTFTLAPPLKQNQCNDELEWFLEEERKYDYLDLVGANAPYTYTRPRTSEDESGPCFITIVADDLFDIDQFTFGDLAKFTTAILDKCTDGKFMASRGGVIEMTDDQEDWGGFSLRVDAKNPYPERPLGGNVSVPLDNGTFPLSRRPGLYLPGIGASAHPTSNGNV